MQKSCPGTIAMPTSLLPHAGVMSTHPSLLISQKGVLMGMRMMCAMPWAEF
jgi:hypothetical protein